MKILRLMNVGCVRSDTPTGGSRQNWQGDSVVMHCTERAVQGGVRLFVSRMDIQHLGLEALSNDTQRRKKILNIRDIGRSTPPSPLALYEDWQTDGRLWHLARMDNGEPDIVLTIQPPRQERIFVDPFLSASCKQIRADVLDGRYFPWLRSMLRIVQNEGVLTKPPYPTQAQTPGKSTGDPLVADMIDVTRKLRDRASRLEKRLSLIR